MIIIYSILSKMLRLTYWLLIIYALLSWFPRAYQSRFGQVIRHLVDPLLEPFRALNLRVGYFDFSILVLLLVIHFLERLLPTLFGFLGTLF